MNSPSSKPPVEAVLFDFGGVLSPGGRAGTMAGIISELTGIEQDKIDISDIHKKLRIGQISTKQAFKAINSVVAVASQNDKRSEKKPKVTPEYYLKTAEYLHQRSEKVNALARNIRQTGIITAIFSNVYEMSAQHLRANGSYNGFDPVILSCEEGLAKPDKAFFELAIEKVGVEPGKMLFIDDQADNINEAEQWGIFGIHAHSENQIVVATSVVLKERNNLAL